MTFVPGGLYKTHLSILIYTPVDNIWENRKSWWLAKESLVSIIDINSNSFVIHTYMGVFATTSFYSYLNCNGVFEKVA